MASGAGGSGVGGHSNQANNHPSQATFTVNLDNIPFQVAGTPSGGGTAAPQGNGAQGNIGRVMQDIWPQIEQRITQQALAALRDRHPHGGVGPAGHPHSHAHITQHPVGQPVVNPGPPLSQQTEGQHLVINIGGGGAGNNTVPDENQNTDDHHGNQGPPTHPPAPPPGQQQQQQQIPTVRSLLKSMEGSLPFVFLMLAKVLYNHRLGEINTANS